MTTRRRRGEDGISFEHRGPCRGPHRHRHCPGLWRGEITVGYTGDGKRQRRKVARLAGHATTRTPRSSTAANYGPSSPPALRCPEIMDQLFIRTQPPRRRQNRQGPAQTSRRSPVT